MNEVLQFPRRATRVPLSILRFLFPIFLLLVSGVLSGCFLAPFIGAFKQAGVTQADREALLPKEVKRFTDALFWGTSGPIMAMVAEPARKTVSKQVADASDVERVVESKVISIDFDDGAHKAKVDVKVRFYRVPYYIVQDRVETQQWEFSFNDGWQLTDRVLGETVH